jgi:hypothetical protein
LEASKSAHSDNTCSLQSLSLIGRNGRWGIFCENTKAATADSARGFVEKGVDSANMQIEHFAWVFDIDKCRKKMRSF